LGILGGVRAKDWRIASRVFDGILIASNKGNAMRKSIEKYEGIIFARCPAGLPPLVAFAAQARMTSLSSYVRAAVLEQLQRDGYRRTELSTSSPSGKAAA
jgi:hypothetical protein